MYHLLFRIIPIFFIAITLVGCSSNGDKKETQKTYDNPFEYCTAVGTVDTPGPEYTGPKVPEAIATELRDYTGIVDDYPHDNFINGTYWRCMNGSVYACFLGNNIPCEDKANVSKEPNDGMLNYCGENPDADLIPMYASGRATVYEWKCVDGTPEIVKQIAQTDESGYIKDIWYKINP